MDLTERYLTAVRFLLPLKGRDDIIAELRDALTTRREEQEAELGRPLAREEESALLRAFGNPIAVAGRFGGQQTVVGPELFPLYRLAALLLFGVSLVAGVIGVLVAAFLPAAADESVAAAFKNLFDAPLASLGATTLVFAILDRSPWRANTLRFLDAWDPRDLPRPPRVRRRQPGWPHHVAGIVAQIVFILCWTGAIPIWGRLVFPLDHHPGVVSISFAPILALIYWPVLALAFAAIVVEAAHLAGRAHHRIADSLSAGIHAVVVAVAATTLNAGRWVVVTGADGAPAAIVQDVTHGLNQGIQITLVVVIVVSAIGVGADVWRFFRHDPEPE
jgi:hypothetical protein